MENDCILEAQEIHKTFSIPTPISILSGVNLKIQEGESVAIIGRSGEGKSTLLNIMGSLDSPSKGTLTINGNTVTSANKNKIRNTHIGFVFQSFHLLEDYTVIENILMPARIARKSVKKGSEAELRGWELLRRVGLEERAHFYGKQLSGGEKQRVAIARALCNNPTLLLADEPSGNLDSQNAEQIHELLLQFSRDPGKSVVIVTHDLQLASLCDRQYELKEGKLFPVR